MPVTLERSGAIALIAIDNPPVNATSHDVRAGLMAVLRELHAAAELKAAVLQCAGRTFIAGADMKEFGKPSQPPILPDVAQALEDSAKPIVAAIHGTALGGGLEIALGCHVRIATPDAALGFPEVHVGVIPGAGGTQRLPRLIGVEAAAEIITSGRRVPAKEALALGLIDEIAETDLTGAATAMARRLATGDPPARRLSKIPAPAAPDGWSGLEARTRKAARGLAAPLRALDAIRAATALPFAEGLIRERALFATCRDSMEGRALRHAFFAERQASSSGLAAAIEPMPVKTVGVIGAGSMGRGIALCFASAGIPVTLVDRDDASLDKARAALAALIDGDVSKGRLDAEKAAARKALIHTAADLQALADRDLVVEAVFEDLAVKQALFTALKPILQPSAILATNTSYLDVAALAAASGRPDRVLGLHFFNPAHLMKLLEIVVTDQSAPQTIATGFAVAKALRKNSVLAGNAHGFIGNRIWSAYRRQADYLAADGATPEQVDKAITDFGFRMGPFAALDLAGLDVGLAMRKRWRAANPDRRYVDLSDRLCALGRTGQKAGTGWYRYQDGDRTPLSDPQVAALIASVAAEQGLTRRSFSDDEIRQRILLAMVNEACHVLNEGVARRPSDIDVVLLNGYGFPRAKGGPMFWADETGLSKLAGQLEGLSRGDPADWNPSPMLRALASAGRSFADLNAAD